MPRIVVAIAFIMLPVAVEWSTVATSASRISRNKRRGESEVIGALEPVLLLEWGPLAIRGRLALVSRTLELVVLDSDIYDNSFQFRNVIHVCMVMYI
jgi:hypothetical protein